MKKYIIISTIILGCFSLTSCSKENVLKSDTPINTGLLTKIAIDNKDYATFNELFTEDKKGAVTEEEFNKLSSITTAGSSHELYDVITFQNGEMLLVRLTPEKINGQYKIEDVVKLSDEMKEFFNKYN